MTRLKQAWLALRGRKKSAPVVDDEPQGVLFGLDPPAGCVFEVSLHRGASWHVYVKRGHEILAHECSIIHQDDDDEKLIVAAAKRALAATERAQRTSELEGCYPPKIAKGKTK